MAPCDTTTVGSWMPASQCAQALLSVLIALAALGPPGIAGFRIGGIDRRGLQFPEGLAFPDAEAKLLERRRNRNMAFRQ